MAMGLLKLMVNGENESWLISSAGVWALENQSAATNTIELLKDRGIDISDHKSKLVTQEMIEEFNLILVMERNQKEALKTAFPKQAEKIFLLSEMVGESFEIVDPIGGTMADFNATGLEIDNILEESFSKINQLSAD
jgi:protein-tyrosine-phosphatase